MKGGAGHWASPPLALNRIHGGLASVETEKKIWAREG